MRAKIKGFARICPSYADFWCMGNCVKATCSEHRETMIAQAVRKWERALLAFLRTPGAWDGAQEVCQLMPES